MGKNQVLRLFSSVATTFMLTACGATMKPDHAQVFDSFKERRPPKENVFAERGTLDELPEQRASRFTPYTGSTYVSDGSKPEAPQALTEGVAKEATQLGNSIPRVIEPDGTSSTVPSREQRTVWDRLKEKFSSLDTSVVRKGPAENHMMLASAQDAYQAQGSADDYSYYEMAEEVVEAAPIEGIEVKSILLAEANPSAPLVDVPEPKSYSDLKHEGAKLNKQNLKDVPAAPKKPKPTKTNKAELKTDTVEMADADGYSIQDHTAKIVYANGQAVVTGSIGVIKASVVN